MKIDLWAEYRFRKLWYFMLFALGCACYFSCWVEPHWFICLPFCLVIGGLSFFFKSVWIKLGWFFMLGMSVASCRTASVHTEFLNKPLWHQQTEGYVRTVLPYATGQIVVVENLSLDKDVQKIPQKARLTFQKTTPVLHVGDVIRFEADFLPPSFEQQRRFYFQGIEARGQIFEIFSILAKERSFLQSLRTAIMDRLRQLLPLRQAQIAIPLIVGEQRVVSEELYDIYRKAGIAHVLSVSGFHMALLAGFVFFLIRTFLCLLPWVNDHIHAKKVAAIVAFFVTGFYLFLSGVQIPALRAFWMISLVFLGVLTDRQALSLHTLLFVGFALLLFRPEWIMSVSFQLSFVAVLILVGLFDAVERSLPHAGIGRWFGAALGANVLVTLGLTPFIIYHFNQFNPYGIVGNLFTSLFFSCLIMPLLFLGTLLMPFGWEAPILKLAGFVLGKMTDLASFIAHWPYAEMLVPSFSGAGLLLFSCGLAFMCLMRSKMRWIGIPICALSLMGGYLFVERPDLLITNKSVVAFRKETDAVWVHGKTPHWMVARWARKNGTTQMQTFSQDHLLLKGYKIAFDAKTCQGADLAILTSNQECAASQVFIPKKNQTYHVFLNDSLKIQNALLSNPHRLWSSSYHHQSLKQYGE